MFEELDAINWDNLWHGHGSAALFPYWIRALTAQQAQLRQQALYELSHITHQGMIVPETTRLTIPFLIDLLPHQFQIKDREKIIDLLVDVVDAATESSIFGPNEQEAQLVFEVIERGLPIYMHLMDVENRLVQENEEVRYQVARLLGYFPSYTEAIQPILAKAFFQEESERVQLAMLASWERLT